MGDSDKLEKQLAELKEWVVTQPHVPKDMDDRMLTRFLHSCYFDMEMAQNALEAFAGLKATAPELFANRDPMGERMQKAWHYSKVAHLRISGNRVLWVMQIDDPGLKNFDHLEVVRNFLMINDTYFLEGQDQEEEVIAILDAKDISLKIIGKLRMSLANKLITYQEKAIPIRLKQMHMVNTPTFIDKLFSIFKQFVSKDLNEMIHFHATNSDTLYKYISKNDLPRDFGGNLDSLEVYNNKVVDLLRKHRDSLMDDNLWKAPEKKPKGSSKNKSSSVPETPNDSFRTMNID